MKNSVLQSQPDQYKHNTIADEKQELSVGLQSILEGGVKQINKGFVNLSGSVVGNGNGTVHVTVNNYYLVDGRLDQFSYPQPMPPPPCYEPTREYGSGASSNSLSRRGNKRAVLCGITYGKRKFRLKGTINDVNNMKDVLVKCFKFPISCIRVLTEDQHDPNFIPTKRNILESLKWLVKDCQSGDSLVFYYSGHGLQQPDYKEDEIDGLDETICPVDFIKEGMITDNEINSTIVWPLKNDVILHAILDACHSGTTLDLMHVYKQKNGIWNWEDNKPRSKEPIRKHTSGGVAICLSACEDSQMASDTTVFGGKGMNGVMTYFFTKTIREHHSTMTYGELLEKMHREIGKINQSKWCNNILKHIFHPKVEQDLVLSSSEMFDVYRTNFKL